MPPVDDTGAADAQPADDLRSMIASVADKHESAAPDTATQTETAPAAVEPPDEGGEESGASGTRKRGPDGKFAKAEPGDEPAAGTERPAVEPVEKTEPETPVTTIATPAADAPVHWSAADKEKFAGLPADAKAPFLDLYKRMEAGFTPKLQRLSEYERNYQGVPELFAPYAEQLRQMGATPGHIIQRWAQVEQALIGHKNAVEAGRESETGAQMIARLIESYKIDPGAVARILTTARENGAIPAAAPTQAALPPEVMATINDLRTKVYARDAADRQRGEAAAQAQMDRFANEKDAAGNLSHPFFADVTEDMTALARIDAQAGRPLDLASLYDRAVYANPETRSKLLALQKDTEAKQAAAAAKAKTEAARAASSSVTGAPSPGQTANSKPAERPLRDTIADAVRERLTA